MKARPMVLHVVVVLWFCVSLRAEAQEGSDQALIQGTWQCVKTIKEGKQVDQYVGVRAIIQGNSLTWVFPQPDGTTRTTKAIFVLDATKDPKWFDWYAEDKPTQVHKRLYTLEGDSLTWSTNLGTEGRPESFSAGKWQYIMKRVN